MIAAPTAPVVELTRAAGDPLDTVALAVTVEPGLEWMLQRREDDQLAWRTVVHWRAASSPEFWNETLAPSQIVEYRAWSRTARQRVCDEPEPITAWPLTEEEPS